MVAILLISMVQKNVKLPTPPKVWVSGFLFCVLMEVEYHKKTGDANFIFFEFSIGSFFPIALPRFHFNIYAWLHLKSLCVDIYASLVYSTSHLCVVLHFLIFVNFALPFLHFEAGSSIGYLSYTISCTKSSKHNKTGPYTRDSLHRLLIKLKKS